MAKILNAQLQVGVKGEYLAGLVEDLNDLAKSKWNAEPRPTYLRASNLGTGCPLRLKYDIDYGKPLPVSPELDAIFKQGDIMEAVTITLLKQAGYSVTDEQREIEYKGITGSIDCLINGNLVDIKTTSNIWKFDKLWEKDDYGYLSQLSTYAAAIPEVSKKEATLLVWDKNSKSYSQFTYDIEKYVDQKTIEISEMKRYLAGRQLKESKEDEQIRKGKGRYKGGYELNSFCNTCPWKSDCWPRLQAFEYEYPDGTKYKKHFSDITAPPQTKNHSLNKLVPRKEVPVDPLRI